ncbi:MAG TPA: copper resistance CopC family protein [Sphingomicrobium sp.]|nr:copper resistance CopC family protein [Sphingomicrobium sp.]
MRRLIVGAALRRARYPRFAAASLAVLALLAGCAQQPQPAAPTGTGAAPKSQSILAWSKPAAGSTVSGPVNELVLHFSPPARLAEVTVTGPDGAMPMMVTAVGEVEHYSLPLSGLGTGRYTVDWRASVGGVGHRGSFAFQVR